MADLRIALLRALQAAGLVLALVVILFPVYWMVNTSLLQRREIRSPDPTWLPLGGSLDNYRTVFTGDRFTDALTMSLMVTLATVVVAKWEGEFVEASDQELAVAAARGEI